MSEIGKQAVFACKCVAGGFPVLIVIHDNDGDWQFVCGDDHSRHKPHVMCMEHFLEKDARLSEVMDLEPGNLAIRGTPRQKWRREAL